MLLIFAGSILYWIIKDRLYQIFDDGLAIDARIFVERVRLEPDGLKLALDGLHPHIYSAMRELEPFAVVTDEYGRILHKNLASRYMEAMIREGRVGKILKQHSGIDQVVAGDGTRIRFVSLEIPGREGAKREFIHVGRSTYRLRTVLKSYAFFYAYSIPFMLSISLAAGWLITNRALRPFKDIARAAEQISSENLNTKIVTKYGEAEVQALVKSFNSMIDRLDRSFQQMRRFNADAAHELRTPLSILRGETELLLKSPNFTDEEIKAALRSNLEELDRLTRIVNDLLLLSEADAGEQVILKEPIYLRLLIEELIEQMLPLAAPRGVRIKLLDMPDVRVEADGLLLRRALFNLLENAIKYSREQGEVEIFGMVQGQKVRLQIKDYGIGISAADLPFIFDRLFRADRARKREGGGAGLGLAIVKWIIEAHQGSIQVSSSLNQGTTFDIDLPLNSGKYQSLD